ncbi:adipokinetic hormone/corazonin-related peptide receptor variant I-like [Neodiprion virginianus]|uniref:adipokinetic hormone/corazonin-related peptide receptor variant I-like n=1 Tax=Neodiprion virginianus TaxID=2961670 RepID=UPI001EE712DB|nr:adipokinetic hormone/corazonin-related peptide receptor variant I-like [Neodiprion virginianus]
MRFTQQSSYVKIFCCLVLFLVAVMGNFTALVNLSRRKHQRSAVSLMMGHLVAADLLVTFFMIPLEGGFHLIVQWLDGNLACKFFLFLRAFALYLSSNVLVCVSLDRYSAILHPLRNYDARRRGKMMLCGAWICSFFYALPQVHEPFIDDRNVVNREPSLLDAPITEQNRGVMHRKRMQLRQIESVGITHTLDITLIHEQRRRRTLMQNRPAPPTIGALTDIGTNNRNCERIRNRIDFEKSI